MLSKLLPKNFGFFDLFDRHAETAHEGLVSVHRMLAGWPNTREMVGKIVECEHVCDSITHMTVDLMRRTYITPFDPGEIRELISRMDDVIDHAQGATSRLVIFNIGTIPSGLVKLSETLEKAHAHVVTAVKLLRDIKNAEGIEALCRDINSLENAGDDILHEGLARLFAEVKDPVEIIKIKEIFEMLERSVDRCEDVANVIENINIEHRG